MTEPSYHVLVVDDSKRDALLLERTLRQAEDAVFSATCVEIAQAGLDALSTQNYDLVLLDQTEVIEIGMHLALYVGIIQARSFMHIANTVFRSPEFSQT